MTKRNFAAALLSTSAFFALSTPATAQTLDVPAGSTYTLTADETYDALTGSGEVVLGTHDLTIGADGSSSVFLGDITDNTLTYVGSWIVYDGPYWGTGTAPVRSGTEAAAFLFGGTASDYRISTVSDQVADINDMAWYDVYGIGQSLFSSTYRSDANGNGLYDQVGDSSAFVQDNYVTIQNYAFSGGAGMGGLTKVGGGSLTLGGIGDWTGTTTISGGTLIGTTISISGGSIVNNATLRYEQGFDGSVTQNISGSGTVQVLATGGSTVTFAGDLTNASLEVQSGGVTLTGSNAFSGSNGVLLNDGTMLTVASGALVSASGSAIFGYNGGAYSIVNDGTINGTQYGFQANGVTTATLTNSGTLTGGSQAVYTDGAGLVTIDNSGDITGGIVSVGGGDLDITNQASGNIVRVAFGSAIDMSNPSGTAGVLTLDNAGDIVGSGWGVVGRNAADSVVNSGRIASGTISGETITVGGNQAIVLANGGTVTNTATGTIQAGSIAVQLDGTGTVTNSGVITGNAGGVLMAGGTLTNNEGGTITGGTNAVETRADATITNHGLIEGQAGVWSNGISVTGGFATITNDGTIIGHTNGNGILASSSGSVTNEADGQILATEHPDAWGVAFVSGATSATVTNHGLISSGVGVYMDGLVVDGTVTNDGTILGSVAGVEMGAAGTVTNSGTISAVSRGVTLQSGGTVTNSGTIAASDASSAGLLVNGGDLTLTNEAGGSITGGIWGLLFSSGGALDVTNSGTMSGGTYNAIYAGYGDAATITNTASGTMTGGNAGIYSDGTNLSVTNAGLIRVVGGSANSVTSGIYASGTVASVVNNGRIDSTLDTGNGIRFDQSGTVTNSGVIAGGTSGVGIVLNNGGTITNQSGGSIAGGRSGVYSNGGLNLTNSGSIDGALVGAVVLAGGTNTVTNTVDGKIVGKGTSAMRLDGTNTIDNAGLIDGDIDGYGAGIHLVSGSTTVTNTGSILGHSDGFAIYAGSGTLTLDNKAGGLIDGGVSGSVGVSFGGTAQGSITNAGSIHGDIALVLQSNGPVTVSNSGTISGDSYAISADTTGLSVTNSGTISGGLVGIYSENGGTIVNLAGGTIGGTNAAIFFEGSEAGSIDLQAGSTVNGSIVSIGAGQRTLDIATALSLYDASAGTGVDTVTLSATGSLGAMAMGDGNDSFTTRGGAIGGNVDGGAGVDSIAFDVASGSVTYAGNFTGFETGTKTGAGLVNLTGNSVIGTMAVTGGTLAVNGTLTSTVTASGGGRLGGTGTVIGNVTIGSGGILAPGNSIGTVNVTGNLTFASGSTYQVEISPTASDRTNATGNITINGGTVSVLGGAGTYAPLTTYTILSAGGSVTGTFTSVTDDLAFLDPTLVYTANQVLLQMRRNDITFADAAVTPNQVAVADAVQSLPIGGLYDAILVQTVDGARTAYDALSGEIYASTPVVLAQQGDRLRVAQLDAVAAGGEGFGLWADAKAGHAYLGRTGAGSAPVVSDHRDLLVGGTWRGNGFSVVAGGGIASSDVEVEGRASTADVDSWMLGGQLAWQAGPLRLTGGMTYASHDVSTKRAIVFPGFADATTGNQDGTTQTYYGEIAYALATKAVSVEPFLGVVHQRVRMDGVVEDGGIAALSVGSVKLSSTMTEVGVRLAGSSTVGAGKLFPIGTIAWQHLLGDRQGGFTASFDGSDPFGIKGAKRSRDGLRVNAGLGYRLGNASLGVAYDGRLADGDTDHAVRATLSIGL